MTETNKTDEHDSQSLPYHRLWQPTTARWLVVIFGLALAYAVVRYHIASGVAWSHFPLFIMNKTVALAGTAMVACSYLIGKVIRRYDKDPRCKLVVIKFCGLIGFSLASVHGIASLCLITPAYFAKYFTEDGRLNFEGELGLMLGILALWALSLPAITTLPMMPKAIGGMRWKRSQRMGYVCLILVVAHMVALGLRGWLSPEHWPWMLPPISLVAAIIAMIPLVVKFMK
jgi:DMSO/TMAO reductase YedYZ heme-binding membrane subunit